MDYYLKTVMFKQTNFDVQSVQKINPTTNHSECFEIKLRENETPENLK